MLKGTILMPRSLTAEARCKRLEEALPDPDKLEILARWFDMKYPSDANPEVQTDLREWAKKIRRALEVEMAETYQKVEMERDALRLRAEQAEARCKRLEEALLEIRDYSAYNHPDERVINERDKILAESALCTACQYAKEVKWPPSGLCEKHYGPVMRAHDKVSAMFDYKQMWGPQEIARKALEDK